jgi:membrane protease YdiL (CAAX protease family)
MRRVARGVAEPLLLTAILSAVIVGAALLTPVIYPLAVAAGFGDDDSDFLRVYRRLLILGAVAVLFCRYRPWRDGDLASYGLRWTSGNIRGALVAAAVTAAVVVATIAVHFALGMLVWRNPIDWAAVASRAGKYLVAGIVIGLLEELFFRGWTLRRMTFAWGPAVAASAASAMYAGVHAFKPRNLSVAVSHDWSGCLSAFAQWIAFAFDLQRFGPTFAGLFLLGIVLTFLTWRSGSIVPAIAVHSAGILFLYSYGTLTQRVEEMSWAGGAALYDGPLVWLLLLIALVALHPRPSSVPQGVADPARQQPKKV